MKRARVLVLAILMISALAVGFSAKSADAAIGWYTCTVNSVGQTGSGAYVRVTHTGGTFSDKLMILHPTTRKEQLAVFLTAKANTQQVYVQADLAIATPTVLAVYAL